MSFAEIFIEESVQVLKRIDPSAVEACASGLADVRDRGGRLFVLGVGGSAGHASHAVNDFRKLCGFEAYAPTDNVSELTARINDDGWDSVFSAWLDGSRLSNLDGLLVLSVGGGDAERSVSANLVAAMELGTSPSSVDLRHRGTRRRVRGEGRRYSRTDSSSVSRACHPAHRRACAR